MNLNSKYFDRIRINPDGARSRAATAPPCEWHGCGQPGGYRAPKGRHREGEYHNFCLDHVREYNKSYNYFAGMARRRYRRLSEGRRDRPPADLDDGRQRQRRGAVEPSGKAGTTGVHRPVRLLRRSLAPRRRQARAKTPLKNLERRSFAALDLDGTESGSEIKSRYKELVKRLHPDANGGDRSSEDRLRQIIQAYHYLRSAGFC